jgi:ABC-type sulfate/molybdate transport systems ATPase subunit
MTVILVTHDSGDALELANSVILLREGRSGGARESARTCRWSGGYMGAAFLTAGIKNDAFAKSQK